MQFLRIAAVALLLVPACDAEVEPTSTSEFRCASANGAAIIGLEKVTISGTADLGGSSTTDVFSNERIDLSGALYLNGDAVVAAGGEIGTSGNALTIVGTTRTDGSRLTVAPAYAAATAASQTNGNDSLSIVKGNKNVSPVVDGELKLSGQSELTVPAGDYYFDKGISISGQATVILEGPVRFYVNGPVSISGITETNDGSAHMLELISVAEDGVSLSGTSEAQLHVSAPLADVKLSGTTDFAGTVLGNVVTISGTATVDARGDASNYGADSCEEPGDDGGEPGDDGGEPGDDGGEPDTPSPHTPSDPPTPDSDPP